MSLILLLSNFSLRNSELITSASTMTAGVFAIKRSYDVPPRAVSSSLLRYRYSISSSSGNFTVNFLLKRALPSFFTYAVIAPPSAIRRRTEGDAIPVLFRVNSFFKILLTEIN